MKYSLSFRNLARKIFMWNSQEEISNRNLFYFNVIFWLQYTGKQRQKKS